MDLAGLQCPDLSGDIMQELQSAHPISRSPFCSKQEGALWVCGPVRPHLGCTGHGLSEERRHYRLFGIQILCQSADPDLPGADSPFEFGHCLRPALHQRLP